MNKLHILFPSAILEANIQRDLTENELTTIHEFLNDTKRSEGNNQTIDSHVLEHSNLIELKTWIQQQVNEYVHNIQSIADVEFYITNSWLNINKPGEYHHRHSHHNSIVSGVFYVDANEDIDKITFYDMKPDHPLVFNHNELNIYNSAKWWMPAVKGRLYLFPSRMEHDVGKYEEASKNRISLAFNTFAKGFLGDDGLRSYIRLS